MASYGVSTGMISYRMNLTEQADFLRYCSVTSGNEGCTGTIVTIRSRYHLSDSWILIFCSKYSLVDVLLMIQNSI